MAASPPRKSHSESLCWPDPGISPRPACGPWGFRHHGTSRRQSPTSAHARCRAGNGEERGRTIRARNPATLPLESPHQPHHVRRASVMVCYRRRPLPTGWGPYRATRSAPTPGSPHSMFQLNARLRKRRRIGRGGETTPPLPFFMLRAQECAPGHGRLGARWPAGPRPCPARGSRTGAARLMGGEGKCA